MGKHDGICLRVQQNRPAEALVATDRYIRQYLADNYIINIAELKKVQWPNIIDINLGKNSITKIIIK